MSYDALFRQRVEQVESVTGSGTALVSLYVPSGKNLATVSRQMAQEQSEADNIKSDSNRKNVKKALSRVERVLKRYDQTPENGLVVFVGITNDDDTKEFVFDELDQPLEYSDYICDNQFDTDPLRKILAPDNSIGLLIIERGGSVIGELRGTRIITHQVKESNVMGKHKAGGQCLVPRTDVLLPDGATTPLGNISIGDTVVSADFENESFVETDVTDMWEESKTVTKLHLANGSTLTGSSDHTVFVRHDDEISEVPIGQLDVTDSLLCPTDQIQTQRYMHGQSVTIDPELALESCSITQIESGSTEKVIDISTSQGNFVANGFIVHNSAQRFSRRIEKQKENFFDSVRQSLESRYLDSDNQSKVDAFIIGGTQVTVDDFVSNGFLPQSLKKVRAGGAFSVDVANGEQSLEQLVSRARDTIDEVTSQEERELTEQFFESLHSQDTHATYGEEQIQRALNYGAVDTLLVSETLGRTAIAEYESAVENQGGDLVVVSTDFEQGEQLNSAFNGRAALLRYQIE